MPVTTQWEPLDPTPLSAEELRSLIRPTHRVFLPDHVARSLRNRTPSIVLGDADTIGPMLTTLVSTAKQRMEEDGIELPKRLDLPFPPLDSRERTRAEMLSILLPYYSYILFFSQRKEEEALRASDEGIAWARAAGNHRQEALVWNARGVLHEHRCEYEQERHAYREALRIAEELTEDPLFEVSMAANLAAALVARDQLTAALEILTGSIAKTRQLFSAKEQAQLLPSLLLNLGKIKTFRKENREALSLLLEANELARQTDNIGIQAALLTQLGLVYKDLGDRRQDIECQREMVALCEAHNYEVGLIWGYARIAEASLDLKDYENAEKALRMAERYLPKGGSSAQHFVLYKWAGLYYNQGKTEQGIDCCLRLLNIVQDTPPSFIKSATHNLHGQLLAAQENLPEAEDALRRSIAVAHLMEGKVDVIRIIINLAHLLMRMDRNDEAATMLDEAIPNVRPGLAESFDLSEAYQVRGEIAEKMGEYRAALEFVRIGQEIDLKALNRKNQEAMERTRILSEIELLKHETKQERKEREKVESTLAETLLVFEGKRHLLDRVERRLQQTLSFLEKEKAREVIYALKNTLIEIEAEENAEEQHLSYTKTVDQDFLTRLRERWPDLTRKQERLCGLIRSGLTSNEIAQMLNISYEGMRAQRKRLRKRLGLDADENLEKLIAEC